MKNQIKELRVKIDSLAQLTNQLKPIKINNMVNVSTREIDKTYDSLIFAKAWLGKLLGELGVESPYPKDGTRKTVEDIEPTADVADISDYYQVPLEYEHFNHIEKVDWLRQQIKKVVNEIKHLDGGMTNHAHQRPSREFAIARTNAYNYACEARMWLGFELQRIKESEE